jgi:hypothetical protein
LVAGKSPRDKEESSPKVTGADREVKKMKVFRFYDSGGGVDVVGIDRTPEWESTYAFVEELWRGGSVYYAIWHGGIHSGGWDVWEIPPELWPNGEEETTIEAAIAAAADLVNSGRARKVRDCPYCDDLRAGEVEEVTR